MVTQNKLVNKETSTTVWATNVIIILTFWLLLVFSGSCGREQYEWRSNQCQPPACTVRYLGALGLLCIDLNQRLNRDGKHYIHVYYMKGAERGHGTWGSVKWFLLFVDSRIASHKFNKISTINKQDYLVMGPRVTIILHGYISSLNV